MRKKRTRRVIRLKIREIAESRNINMAKLSRMSDVAYNTIRGIWDNENRDISISILDRIARALRVKVTDLYEWVPDEDTNM